METEKNKDVKLVIYNIRKIMNDRQLTQATIAEYAGVLPAQWSKIMKGEIYLRVEQISNIAIKLNMNIIDLFTYPKVYVDQESLSNAERISVTFEISPDKKDILLSLVTKESTK